MKIKSLSLATCLLASSASTLAQEAPKALPLRPVGAAPAVAQDPAEVAQALGFSPSMLRYHSGDALPDMDLLGADGKLVKFSAARGGHPTIVLMAPTVASDERTGPLLRGAKAMAERYEPYGVLVQVWGMWMPTEDFLAEAKKAAPLWPFTLFGDPVGPYRGARENQEERMAHNLTTLSGKLFKGGMSLPLPACFLVDGQGALLGTIAVRGEQVPFDGIANLLLRGGVKLEDKDRPAVVAPASAFAKAPPRPVEAPVQLVAIGTEAKDFEMVDVEGKPVRLADYRGKVILLDFWATWCGPCKAAFPHVQELAAAYKDQGLVVVASCTSDGQKAFREWVKANAGTYPDILFALDPQERKPERASRTLYGVGGIPQQFVIGRDGVIKAAVTGYMAGERLLDAALAAAGLQVPAEVLEQAKKDQAKRDERATKR
jgi:thiol-disulfide isomerase/thioredoxin